MTKDQYYQRRSILEMQFDLYLKMGRLDAAKETKKNIGDLMIQGLEQLGEQDFLDIELRFETENY